MASEPTLLVTGAGGHLGRRVVELLLEAKKSHVIAATRNPGKLSDLAAKGVDVRKADFDDPGSLGPAFKGAERMLLISTDSIDVPGRRRRQQEGAIKAAARAGVRHVVYTSGPVPRPAPKGSVLDDHFWTEEALAASSMSWTIMRHNIYSEAILITLPGALARGELVSAAGDGGRAYVTREDCARADAAALGGSSTDRLILDVTGPKALTQDELAAIASELSDKSVKHVRVSPDALLKGMVSAGIPALLASGLVEFDIDASRGYQAIVTPTVKELTGRDPISVRAYLSANKAALKPQ
jgi:NAD(P)H dehydrogenase (quinone)